MHTFEHKTDGVKVTIQHNGDYSGDAMVWVSRPGTIEEFEIPCEALVAFSEEATRSRLISALENIDLEG